MPKAKCPKCGIQGECEHEGGGFAYQGVFYDVYAFACAKCNFRGREKIPIGHAQNKCPWCGGTCTRPDDEEEKKQREEDKDRQKNWSFYNGGSWPS